MQIHQEMLPVSIKRIELEKSPRVWGQEGGAGLGMDMVLHPSVPSAWSNIHRGSCQQPPASATARAGKQRNGEKPTHNPPPSSPEGLQVNPWVPNSASPTLLVTMGTRHRG